jgi:hypothetical protein
MNDSELRTQRGLGTESNNTFNTVKSIYSLVSQRFDSVDHNRGVGNRNKGQTPCSIETKRLVAIQIAKNRK